MLLDSLEKLADDELRDISARCDTLLKHRDTQRKENAIAEARATLAAAGLTLRDIVRKSPLKAKPAARSEKHSTKASVQDNIAAPVTKSA